MTSEHIHPPPTKVPTGFSNALWSCAIVVMTALVMVLVPFVAALNESTVLPTLGAWAIFVVFFSPFVVIPLHFRWQRPRESSAALAFLTGFASIGVWACCCFCL